MRSEGPPAPGSRAVDPVSRPLDASARVRAGEDLDPERLAAYLAAHWPEDGALGERALPARALSGPLVVEQFPSGFSNLTYLLRLGERELVLRRPPFGNTVKSAHDMGREFLVLSRLAPVYPAAPRPWLYCADESVLGAPFYVMERRRGVILRRQLPPGLELDPATVERLSFTLIDQLADLHQVDYRAAGLGELGRPEGYVRRQVEGWSERYCRATTHDVPDMERLIAWLATNMPPEVGPPESPSPAADAALIHNDFKYDNLLLDPADLTRIVAVLDWEMATVGDPLMDLGLTLAYWVEAGDPPMAKAAAMGPTDLPGSPSRQALAARYAARTGRALDHLLFYYLFGLLKIAVIVQQIYARYHRGHTQDPRFAQLDRIVAVLARQAVAAEAAGKL